MCQSKSFRFCCCCCYWFFFPPSGSFFSQHRPWLKNQIIFMFLVSSPICRFCRQNTVFWEQLDNFISCCLHAAWDWKHSSAEGVYSSSLILEMLTLRAALKKMVIKDSFFLLKDTENRRDQNSLSKGPSGLVLCLYRLQIFFFFFQKLD